MTPSLLSPTQDRNEHRGATRRPASAVPSITGIRFVAYGEAKLVNISTSGLLAECGERIKPGSLVTIVFEGSFVPRTIDAQVTRNCVAFMGAGGGLRYHVGLAFVREIDLGDSDPGADRGVMLPASLADAETVMPAAAAVPAWLSAATEAAAVPVLVIRNHW